ncbi:unnamed protein product [Blepharisma stoltei]|uniref:Uncharacterized protein n=1 Tax=Blepharisma stoltei TaxID=1481888 RepID=A0AAU9K3L6_9CILI|nr:unnamed protein product [Blepharisma stoltei]
MSDINSYRDPSHANHNISQTELEAYLSRSGDLNTIKSLFAILLNKIDFHQSGSNIKEPLKLIVNKLIDEVYESQLNDGSEETRVSVENSVASPQHIQETFQSLTSMVEKRRESLNSRIKVNKNRAALSLASSPEASQRQRSKDIHNSISRIELSKSKQLASHFSEFSSIVGHSSFNTAKRKLLDVEVSSPGPAAYTINEDKIRTQSPRAVIPSNSKRYSYLSESSSPGPSYYYPSRHFMAKY